MNKLEELRLKLKTFTSDLNTLIELAKTEERGFTDEESKKADDLELGFEEVKAEIEKLEAEQKRLSEVSAKANAMTEYMGKARHSIPESIGMTQKEQKRYSLSRAIVAAGYNNWEKAGFEREVSQEVARKLGSQPVGFYIPHEVLVPRTMNTTNTSAIIDTELMADKYIKNLRNNSIMLKLGIQMITELQGDLAIPKQSSSTTAYWVGEDETIPESEIGIGEINFTPKTVAATAGWNKRSLIQSNPSVDALITNDLNRSMALTIDQAIINGSGTAKQPLGILNTTGIGAVAGTGFSNATAIEFETDVDAANARINDLAYVTNATVWGGLKNTPVEDASGEGKILTQAGSNWSMNGYNVFKTNQMPAGTMIFGDFSQLIMAMWGSMDMLVDPFTDSKKLITNVVVNQMVDMNVRHAESFSASKDITFT